MGHPQVEVARRLIAFAVGGALGFGAAACEQGQGADDKASAAKAAKAMELLSTPRKPLGPDPAALYAVPIAGAPVRGGAQAKVTIVEVSTFTCEHCMAVGATLDGLLKKYGGDIRIAHKHFVVQPERGTTPALASCAAHAQGRFFEMKELIWEKGFKADDLGRERMVALAKELGLEPAKFEADMDGAACAETVKADQAQLEKLKNPVTPAFFINGRFVAGAQPAEAFEKLIDEELAKANQRLADGGSVASYYDTWVLAKGATSL